MTANVIPLADHRGVFCETDVELIQAPHMARMYGTTFQVLGWDVPMPVEIMTDTECTHTVRRFCAQTRRQLGEMPCRTCLRARV